MIRDLLPRTSYERESFLKSFLLFFLTIESLLVVVIYLLYQNEVSGLKTKIFLQLKNFSYTFKGEDFKIDLVQAQKGKNTYELYEGKEGLYILVPVPVSQRDLIKVIYPRERYLQDLRSVKLRYLLILVASSTFSLFISVTFSLYSLNPLRRALKMIEEVTKDIIHDLNTPLMTLMVNLKILREKLDTPELERASLALKQIQNLRENLSPLMEKRELNLEELDLKELVEGELESLTKLYPDIEVKKTLTYVRVRADRNAVNRIVSNLLSNAFKHNRGKWINVTLREEELVIENPSAEVKNPQKLFERYYRESQRGMGLGLSIVKKLCSEMGWKVSAEYREGVFRIKVTFK